MLDVGSEVDGYELIEKLGEGAMGAVFLARRRNGGVVAVKVVRHDRLGREHRQRFRREIRTLCDADQHPNIVRLYHESEDPEGDAFAVMERLHGPTLQQRLDAAPDRRLPIAEMVEVAGPILDALAFAHGRRIVHRDVKPENIVLAKDPTGQVVPKLIDFGLALDLDAHAESTLTVTRQRPGTVRFMAPEQARAERDLDGRVDLYAMGVVLYVALAGAWPYDFESDRDWLDALGRHAAVVPLRRRIPDIPPALAAVVHKALEGDRVRRYPSAEAMCDALERATAARSGLTLASLEGATLPVRLDKFLLEREIGHGGMGRVYEARNTELGKRVAIKTLSANAAGDDTLEARFEREGATAAQFDHENIVSVWDSGKVGAVRYLVMEFLEGESLRERLRRGPLSLRETADVMLPICAAVDHMHHRKALHRDLKPGNVMLARRTRGTVPTLIDFGIAKAAPSAHTEDTDVDTNSGVALGTPEYMAPEVLRSAQNATPASDVFALCVMLHECIAGSRPFERTGGGRATPLAQRGVEVPRELARVIDRGLAGDLSDRPTAAELADSLAPYADDNVRGGWIARHGGAPAVDAGRPRRPRVLWGAVGSVIVAAVATIIIVSRGLGGGAPGRRVDSFGKTRGVLEAPVESGGGQEDGEIASLADASREEPRLPAETFLQPPTDGSMHSTSSTQDVVAAPSDVRPSPRALGTGRARPTQMATAPTESRAISRIRGETPGSGALGDAATVSEAVLPTNVSPPAEPLPTAPAAAAESPPQPVAAPRREPWYGGYLRSRDGGARAVDDAATGGAP